MKSCLLLSLLFVLSVPFQEPAHNSAGASVETGRSFDITIDTHEDTPQRFLDENYDVGSTDPRDLDFISLDKARAGHLDAIFFSIGPIPQNTKAILRNERWI